MDSKSTAIATSTKILLTQAFALVKMVESNHEIAAAQMCEMTKGMSSTDQARVVADMWRFRYFY